MKLLNIKLLIKMSLQCKYIKERIRKTFKEFADYVETCPESEYTHHRMDDFKYRLETLDLSADFVLQKEFDNELYQLQNMIPQKLRLIYLFT